MNSRRKHQHAANVLELPGIRITAAPVPRERLNAVIKQCQLNAMDGIIRIVVSHSRAGDWLLTAALTPPPPLPLGTFRWG
jgi:hypothetical protein